VRTFDETRRELAKLTAAVGAAPPAALQWNYRVWSESFIFANIGDAILMRRSGEGARQCQLPTITAEMKNGMVLVSPVFAPTRFECQIVAQGQNRIADQDHIEVRRGPALILCDGVNDWLMMSGYDWDINP
jgi:hypothetical protein